MRYHLQSRVLFSNLPTYLIIFFVPQIERPILSDKSTITSILIAPTTLTSYRKRNLLLAKLVRKEHEGLIGK